MANNGMEWHEILGGTFFVAANPDLADMLGDMDLHFENFHFACFIGFQNSGFPGSQISKIWPVPGLSQAGLGPWAEWALGGWWALGRVRRFDAAALVCHAESTAVHFAFCGTSTAQVL